MSYTPTTSQLSLGRGPSTARALLAACQQVENQEVSIPAAARATHVFTYTIQTLVRHLKPLCPQCGSRSTVHRNGRARSGAKRWKCSGCAITYSRKVRLMGRTAEEVQEDGTLITVFRKSRGWSQGKTARWLGVHRSTLGKYERGERRVSWGVARKVAEEWKEVT